MADLAPSSPQPSSGHATGRATGAVGNAFMLWFGLLGGVVAWMIHLFAGFILLYFGCNGANARMAIAAATIVPALVAAAALLVAYLSWRKGGARTTDDVGGALGRSRFLALAGMGLSALSLIIIVSFGIPLAAISPC